MALTPVNKIYSPDPQETPLVRTQMSAMASSVEAALNSLRSTLRTETIELVKTEAPAPSPENVAKALGYALVVDSKAPAETSKYGVPVLWFDTRTPGAWSATAPKIDDVAKTVTIPTDDGATYMLNGEAKTAGVYPFTPSGSPIAITVVAKPKDGYALTGTDKWSGFITAGWSLLGVDTFTSGEYAASRSPFGVPYLSATGAGNITPDGLVHSKHGANLMVTLGLSERKSAMRLSVDYDITTGVTGSKPSVSLSVGYRSVAYADRNALGVTLTYGAGSAVITGGSTGADTLSLTPTGETIPLKGTLTVEAVGTDVKVYIGSTLVATGVMSGAANGMRAMLMTANNRAVAKNFKVEVQ